MVVCQEFQVRRDTIWSVSHDRTCCRKYYDDCAQILSEHILAAIKPAALTTFSTLDPLVNTSLNRLDEPIRERSVAAAIALSRADSSVTDDADYSSRFPGTRDHSGAASPTRPDVGELLVAATKLVDGALPVREFPNSLTSEPASISQSANSSVVADNGNPDGIDRTDSRNQITHQEELRCVVAVVRHGDRTPKQKLKLNLSEPHILRYFHAQ